MMPRNTTPTAEIQAAEKRLDVLRVAFNSLYDAIIVIEEFQGDTQSDKFDEWVESAGQITILKQAAKTLSAMSEHQLKVIGSAYMMQRGAK